MKEKSEESLYMDILVFPEYQRFEFATRVIKDIKELAQDEYAIAFRIGGVDGVHDFHFMKRAKNGRWYHKAGGFAIQSIKKEQVFGEEWITGWFGANHYRGELVLFAKKF